MSDYSVGITLNLIDSVSAGLTAIGGRMAALGTQANGLNSSLMMIGKGAGLAFVGIQGLQALSAPIEQAQKFQTELARFGTLGFGDKVNSQAAEYARGMKTVGTSTVENMALVGDAMAVFKDLHEAEFAAPIMAKMKFANEALYGKEGGGSRDKALMDMMKVIEFRGGTTSEKEFATQADYAQKAISGSRNRVNPSEMLQALKTGGVGLSRRSNEAFYLQAEPLIQEFGGSRYGTAAMSIYQNLVQARGSIASQQELYRLGLIREDAAIFNKLGKLKKFKAGGMIGSDILETQGEQAFLEKVLLPKFKEKGITGDENIIREIGMIMGNRTGSALMSRIYQQREKLTMQGQANMQAESLGAVEQRASETMSGKQIMLHEKWNSLLETLGTNALPLAISATQGLINVVNAITNFAQAHPTITRGLIVGFTSLMAAMAIGGTVMILVGAFRMLGIALNFGGALTGAISAVRMAIPFITSVLTGLGTAIMWVGRALLANPIGLVLTAIAVAGIMIYRNWSTIQPMIMRMVVAVKAGWRRVVAAVTAGWNKVVYTASSAIAFVVARWNSGAAAIKSTVSAVIAFIVSAFQSLSGAISGAFSSAQSLAGRVSGLANSAMAAVGIGKAKASTVNPVAPASAKTTVVHTQINMDGHKVAKVVTHHQSKAVNKPMAGTSRHDGNMSPRYVGAH